MLSGFLFGAAVAAAAVDLLVFHLLLQWHHFYDLSTPAVGLAADGVLHAASWFTTVLALFLLADLRRRAPVSWPRWVAAAVTGVGAFQLFDGVVDHKVLGIHQVRYGVDLLWYDVAWTGSAVLLLLVGALLLRRSRPARAAR